MASWISGRAAHWKSVCAGVSVRKVDIWTSRWLEKK
jgi:hypothetical protein